MLLQQRLMQLYATTTAVLPRQAPVAGETPHRLQWAASHQQSFLPLHLRRREKGAEEQGA
jgi:hypothetical protein